jgi:hypothetical protein
MSPTPSFDVSANHRTKEENQERYVFQLFPQFLLCMLIAVARLSPLRGAKTAA